MDKYEARRGLPPIGGEYGGATGDWMRERWAKVVGTLGQDPWHAKRGVDAGGDVLVRRRGDQPES